MTNQFETSDQYLQLSDDYKKNHSQANSRKVSSPKLSAFCTEYGRKEHGLQKNKQKKYRT